ncbi:hypothetical protein WG66_002547 [Moniliophthora roreri]|nr:hypothetical protein WG66_002547 [Moniliophthora roreri]
MILQNIFYGQNLVMHRHEASLPTSDRQAALGSTVFIFQDSRNCDTAWLGVEAGLCSKDVSHKPIISNPPSSSSSRILCLGWGEWNRMSQQESVLSAVQLIKYQYIQPLDPQYTSVWTPPSYLSVRFPKKRSLLAAGAGSANGNARIYTGCIPYA